MAELTELTARVKVEYPIDPKDLPTFYTNSAQIYLLADGDVYLDFSTIQAHTMLNPRPSGEEMVIPAIPVARVIMTRAHAIKLKNVLNGVLKDETKA